MNSHEQSHTPQEFTAYEYREGFAKVRVEKVDQAVNIATRAFRRSTFVSIPLADLLPTPGRADVIDSTITSAMQLGGVASMGIILAVQFARFSVTWWTFVVAFGVGAAWLASAYLLAPMRHYVVFTRCSGVYAFALKIPKPEARLEPLVAALSASIREAQKGAPNASQAVPSSP